MRTRGHIRTALAVLAIVAAAGAGAPAAASTPGVTPGAGPGAVAATPIRSVPTAIAAGGGYTCLLVAGVPWCWGDNRYGELGDGSNENRPLPTRVHQGDLPAGTPIVRLATGFGHTCALSDAGRAYCWGRNDDGQLGDGSTTSRTTPVAVDVSGVLAGVRLTQITGGYSHTCALSDAGRAYCWGSDWFGALGAGGGPSQSRPVAVDLRGVLAGQRLVRIAASDFDTCALSAAGQAYCWGYNRFGQLGQGSQEDQLSPVAVERSGVLAGVRLVRLAVGGLHVCALSDAGRAYCWGYNASGQLGDGSTIDRTTPVAVLPGALAGARLARVAAGAEHTCVASTAGRVFCWGSNRLGSVGDGTTVMRTTAVRITIGSEPPARVVAVTAGAGHSCALTLAGRAFCWGWNEVGQVGDATTTNRLRPTPVLGVPRCHGARRPD